MRWFYNLKTSAKLMIGYVVLSAAVAIAGFIGVGSLEKLNDMLGKMHHSHMTGLSKIAAAHVLQLEAVRAVRGSLLAPTREDAEKAGAEVERKFVALDTALKEAEVTLVRAEGKALLQSIRNILPEWESQIRAMRDLKLAGKMPEALEQMKAARTNGDRLQADFEGLTAQKLAVGAEAYEESQAIYGHSRSLLIGISIAAVALGLLLGYALGRLIGGTLSRAVQVLEAVAARDFTQSLEIDSTDEVGQMANALNEAVRGVQTALLEVRDVADSVATASKQLSTSAEEIASGAQEQASSLEETAANLEEITATVKQSAENAQQASQLGVGARDTAEKGGTVVGNAVDAMGEINQASKRIADIITTIDEIAFQTNLLALNAAVEAARAGEQGRGFAVVAAEVRNLAQRSATAAKEIKGLIQDSVRKVEGGSDLVNQSGQRLGEIVSSVKRVTDLVAEMASATREQSSGIDQVNKAVAQMDQVTQSNSAQTQELSGTAESMSQQAEQLRRLVAQFRLGDDGQRRTQPASTPRRTSPPARPGSRLRPVAKRAAQPVRRPDADGHGAGGAGNGGHTSALDAAMVAALSAEGGADKSQAGEFEDV
jgi:methyl-accepting chemotaxis protein